MRLMMSGVKNENTKRPMEKKTLKEMRRAQSPETQISLIVPIKKVKIKSPTADWHSSTSCPGQPLPDIL